MDTHDTACIDDRVVDASPDAPLQPAKPLEPPSPGETSTEIEVPVTTQDGVTVIPTEAIPSMQVATATDLVTESLILQPVETVIESVTKLGQALVETTVTTVAYTIIDQNNPSTMTVT
ncbi:uncharacterized protein FFB20_02139 [Fusarium fujikuroi]|uniref:Uncharacterized protein n=2 Tax=Fusarium fujikuroi TaxID=5127 RepID=S0EKM0_GIBF5|nr:uncharacterized protein FFUJ_10906 [Fusarium fujikuroi IMI 58289]KLP03362.1 uncharacterized protein Y057_4644 [Fusarium fujikuroi]KLP18250.1 uncharacterized protein LW94_2692 [Fusarium fujikuroi]QGI70244.1 hypothetical protein CEK27_002573 [Fusarium fujikuroi]QGI87602.1 hypothetical protein CEK25_002558 [Fusarium fujikuroi]QGJ01133.1 hypothetical protein CEK26_002577 [Fusarium fujikuroi]